MILLMVSIGVQLFCQYQFEYETVWYVQASFHEEEGDTDPSRCYSTGKS